MTLKRITLFILLISSVTMAADMTMSQPAINMAELLEKAFINLCGQFTKLWPYSIAIVLLYVAMRYVKNLIPIGNDATGKKPVNTSKYKSKQKQTNKKTKTRKNKTKTGTLTDLRLKIHERNIGEKRA